MSKINLIVCRLAALFVSFAVLTASAAPSKSVYMLRLDDEIGSSTWRYTREALDEASRTGADLLLVHINTYGGSVVHADSIRTALLNCPLPVVGYVDNNAASAGALIAMACDTVYMRGGGTMGAVTVVNGADGAAMPDKYQSYMRAMMRATAERHGRRDAADPDSPWRRDPAIAEAMVDPRVNVPGLVDSTRVLTFTADEAVRWGYADGKAESIPELLNKLDIPSYTLTEYQPTWVDRLIGFLTSPGIQAVLVMLILGGIYLEMHSPGVGFPSAVAIIAAGLYFLPLLLTGIASPWIVLLFALGVVLMVLEIFVIPGFGVTGIAGIVLICTSLFLGLIEGYTFSLTHMDTSSLWKALGTLTAGIALAVVAVWYLTSKYGPKWLRRTTTLTTQLRSDEGFIGVDMTPCKYIGQTGTAVTDMRPAGKVRIGKETLDAVGTLGFINAGTPVKVTRYENAQIYVTPED